MSHDYAGCGRPVCRVPIEVRTEVSGTRRLIEVCKPRHFRLRGGVATKAETHRTPLSPPPAGMGGRTWRKGCREPSESRW